MADFGDERHPDTQFSFGVITQRHQLTHHRHRPLSQVGLFARMLDAFLDTLGEAGHCELVQLGLGGEEELDRP